MRHVWRPRNDYGIEDKKLYKLFQYAAALAQLYLITSKHDTWNNVIISYAGECKEHG